MKKILVGTTIFLGILVIVLASVIVGMLIPRPGVGGANFAGGGAPQVQQQRPQLPGKKPSEYKIGIPYKKAVAAQKPFVAFFYADWCPHCMQFAPIFEKLSKKYKKHFNFVMVNAEASENANLVQDYQIKAYPTVFIVEPSKMNKIFIDSANFASAETMGAQLDKFLNK